LRADSVGIPAGGGWWGFHVDGELGIRHEDTVAVTAARQGRQGQKGSLRPRHRPRDRRKRSRLELAKETESALFLSRLGRRPSTVRLARLVKAHGRTVGVAISTHSLRHACATHLVRGGADIRQVQALLGHRQLESTAIYTRVEVADLPEVLRRCHPRERAVTAAGSKIRSA
jgi:integrase